jgi:solute carrier family 25 (mitochondrial S-adenosylmethionine transporter), member 26
MGSEAVPFDHWGSWWRENSFCTSLLAGAVSGVVAEAVLFPLDSLKTRLQSPSGFRASGAFGGLYAGLRPALLGCAPASAIFFTTYERTKEIMKRSSGDDLKPWHLAIASILGECSACVVRVPTEYVKQRLQAGYVLTVSHALRDLRSARRSGAFSAAFRATVCRDLCFSGLQFPIYEALKVGFESGEQGSVGMAEAALCGSVAGMCSGFLTTPLDKCKTQMMLQGNSSQPIGLLNALRNIYGTQGIAGLFSGASTRVAWMGIGGLIFLGSYECCKNVLRDLNMYRDAEEINTVTEFVPKVSNLTKLNLTGEILEKGGLGQVCPIQGSFVAKSWSHGTVFNISTVPRASSLPPPGIPAAVPSMSHFMLTQLSRSSTYIR